MEMGSLVSSHGENYGVQMTRLPLDCYWNSERGKSSHYYWSQCCRYYGIGALLGIGKDCGGCCRTRMKNVRRHSSLYSLMRTYYCDYCCSMDFRGRDAWGGVGNYCVNRIDCPFLKLDSLGRALGFNAKGVAIATAAATATIRNNVTIAFKYSFYLLILVGLNFQWEECAAASFLFGEHFRSDSKTC